MLVVCSKFCGLKSDTFYNKQFVTSRCSYLFFRLNLVIQIYDKKESIIYSDISSFSSLLSSAAVFGPDSGATIRNKQHVRKYKHVFDKKISQSLVHLSRVLLYIMQRTPKMLLGAR